jgi:hypothetical protein
VRLPDPLHLMTTQPGNVSVRRSGEVNTQPTTSWYNVIAPVGTWPSPGFPYSARDVQGGPARAAAEGLLLDEVVGGQRGRGGPVAVDQQYARDSGR